MKRLLSTAALILLASISVVAFQNCSPSSNEQNTEVTKVVANRLPSSGGNNGEGYLGKTYVNVADRSPCSDGSNIHSAIYIKNSTTAQVIRANCEDVAPKSFAASTLHLSPHNYKHVVMNKVIYEQIDGFQSGLLADEKSASILFCRKSTSTNEIPNFSRRNSSAATFMYDLIINTQMKNDQWAYSMGLRAGAYDRQLRISESFTQTFSEVGADTLIAGQRTSFISNHFGFDPAVIWSKVSSLLSLDFGRLTGIQLHLKEFGGKLKGATTLSPERTLGFEGKPPIFVDDNPNSPESDYDYDCYSTM